MGLFLKKQRSERWVSCQRLEAEDVLDIMRLPADDQYGYNRYLDSLHLKASEMFTLETEAKFKVAEDIAKNAI